MISDSQTRYGSARSPRPRAPRQHAAVAVVPGEQPARTRVLGVDDVGAVLCARPRALLASCPTDDRASPPEQVLATTAACRSSARHAHRDFRQAGIHLGRTGHPLDRHRRPGDRRPCRAAEDSMAARRPRSRRAGHAGVARRRSDRDRDPASCAVIVERVNRFFGWPAVGRLALRQAPLSPARAQIAAAPDPAVMQSIAASLADVADDDLRQALARLGASVEQNRRSSS